MDLSSLVSRRRLRFNVFDPTEPRDQDPAPAVALSRLPVVQHEISLRAEIKHIFFFEMYVLVASQGINFTLESREVLQ